MIALEVVGGRIVGESSMRICHMAPAGPTSALGSGSISDSPMWPHSYVA